MTTAVAKVVLVVDDDPDTRELLLTWLDDDPRCRKAVGASTVVEALARGAALMPDAVLTDFHLGMQTCADLLPQLRKLVPQAFVLVHTAHRDAVVASGVLDLGADMVIGKGELSVGALVDLLLGATLSR